MALFFQRVITGLSALMSSLNGFLIFLGRAPAIHYSLLKTECSLGRVGLSATSPRARFLVHTTYFNTLGAVGYPLLSLTQQTVRFIQASVSVLFKINSNSLYVVKTKDRLNNVIKPKDFYYENRENCFKITKYCVSVLIDRYIFQMLEKRCKIRDFRQEVFYNLFIINELL